MKQLVNLMVNGEMKDVAVEPSATLIDVLRDELGIVSPKRGCDTGRLWLLHCIGRWFFPVLVYDLCLVCPGTRHYHSRGFAGGRKT